MFVYTIDQLMIILVDYFVRYSAFFLISRIISVMMITWISLMYLALMQHVICTVT